MFSLASTFFRDTLFGFLTALSSVLGSFILNIIAARVLGVSEMGSYTLAVWVVTTTVVIVGIGLPFSMARFLPVIYDSIGPDAALQSARYFLSRSLAVNLLPLAGAAGYIYYTGYLHLDDWAVADLQSLTSPIPSVFDCFFLFAAKRWPISAGAICAAFTACIRRPRSIRFRCLCKLR